MITGDKIRKCRQMMGIPLKEFADNLYLSYSSYSRIERGQTKLTESRIEEILKALGVSREHLDKINETITTNFNYEIDKKYQSNLMNTELTKILDYVVNVKKSLDMQHSLLKNLIRKLEK